MTQQKITAGKEAIDDGEGVEKQNLEIGDEQQLQKEQPPFSTEKFSGTRKLNAFTVVLVLAFLVILLAESVGAGALMNMPPSGRLAKPNEFTKSWEECKEIGKSDASCLKTATAVGKKSPTPKACLPYKPGRAVGAGELINQYVTYYSMNTEQIAQFVKINGLSPAYPNTVIYTGMVYCLPYGVDKRKAEGAYATESGVTGFDPNRDFYYTIADINGSELSFDLVNFPPNDKISVWYWKKPPAISGWNCQKSIDDVCFEVSYGDGTVYEDGYSGPEGGNRRIWLAQFLYTKSRVTLVFPDEVGGWNGVYVCMHSLKRDEMDSDKDRPAGYYPSYHRYCQYINMNRPHTTAIVRPAPTDHNPPTRFPLNTPCNWFINPFWNQLDGTMIDAQLDGTHEIWHYELNYSTGWNDNSIEFDLDGSICYRNYLKPTCEPVVPLATNVCYTNSFCYWDVSCKAYKQDPRNIVTPPCMPPCNGTRIPTPINTPCGNYGACPGTRIPYRTPASASECLNYPSFYPIEYIPTLKSPACQTWWKTPVSKR